MDTFCSWKSAWVVGSAAAWILIVCDLNVKSIQEFCELLIAPESKVSSTGGVTFWEEPFLVAFVHDSAVEESCITLILLQSYHDLLNELCWQSWLIPRNILIVLSCMRELSILSVYLVHCNWSRIELSELWSWWRLRGFVLHTGLVWMLTGHDWADQM